MKIAVPPQTPQFGLDQGESRADEVQSEFFFQYRIELGTIKR